jgi:hypothetical protein
MDPLLEIRDAMRVLGIRSLTIELEPGATIPAPPLDPDARDTEPPPNDAALLIEKGPSMCKWDGCSNPNGGMFDGVAPEYCERHALAAAGVK